MYVIILVIVRIVEIVRIGNYNFLIVLINKVFVFFYFNFVIKIVIIIVNKIVVLVVLIKLRCNVIFLGDKLFIVFGIGNFIIRFLSVFLGWNNFLKNGVFYINIKVVKMMNGF